MVQEPKAQKQANQESKAQEQSLVNARSFTVALAVIAILMVASYILTLITPCRGIPIWQWVLSPILVLGAEGSGTIIAILIFLLVIGGIFNALNSCGFMRYLIDFIACKFGAQKYRLMAALIFFFMALGALIGSFEECVPLVPIVVALAVTLGWDAITGLAMSVLACGCGFAAGVFNPFTVGVAQELAGLPMFSGAGYRAVAFVLIYALLLLFVRSHAKKIDAMASTDATAIGADFTPDPAMSLGLKLFGGILGTGIAIVLISPFVPILQDLTMIIVAVMFLVAGLAACKACKMPGGKLAKALGNGVVSMLPAVLMILMASSIKYTLETAGTLDVLLAAAMQVAQNVPSWALILFIYLIVLVMNFFIASGSAKAFILIPLIVPLAEAFGVSPQLCIMAYAFGDGFSNVIYPTNPVLLISLGLADVSYGKWFKWSVKFQLANFALTSALLLIGYAIGY